MARIKNNVTKSGASFLNERTRLKNTQQTNQPYIPNGTNVETLSIDKKYNDENTINFDNLSKYSTPQAYFNQYQNDRNTTAEQLASPSTLSDLAFPFEGSNNFLNDQTTIIEKSLKKGNIITSNFTPFNGDKDKNYSQNILDDNINDFIKGEGEYSFLDSNLYEETSIEIELDVPQDSLLEYTAKMQEMDDSNNVSYFENSWAESPYNFRKNFVPNVVRKNSPFLMYNFKEKCFESRGYHARINETDYEGKDLDIPDIAQIPSINFFVKKENSVITDINVNQTLSFKDKLRLNLKNHHFALTNTPINQLRPEVNSFNIFNYFSLPTMQFGFPHFPTFHAFEENLMPMKNFLNKNIIIDRVTIDCDLKVKAQIKIPQDNEINVEDLDFRDGLNFSLNYFILNDNKNKKDVGLNFLSLNPQEYFKDFNTVNNLGNPINSKLSSIQSIKHYTSVLLNNLNSEAPYDLEYSELLNSKQNLKIHRKLWKDIDDSLIITDMTNRLDEISFNKNIVSFGNVLFHASNKNFLSDIIDNKPVYTNPGKLLRFQQMKNNNDLVIDTLADNISKSLLINNNVSKIPDDYIFLDFEDHIKLNSYVKKASSYPRYLNSHNLNYQIEFKSSLNSTRQYSLFGKNINLATGEGLLEEVTYNYTRNMLNNKLDGKDLINHQSQLIHDITKKINARKTSKDLFKNLKKIDQTSFDEDETLYYYNNYQASDLTNLHFSRTSNFSPYVLSSNDNLAFCFSISPTISPRLFIHNCQIKAGKVKFTLHGYQKRNNQIFIDENSLKEATLNTNIIDDKSIVTDDYSNMGFLSEYINTFNDRIFQGTFELDTRKLNETTPSKIKSGKSYIPYTKVERDVNKTWIYDNDQAFTQVLTLLLTENNQNPNINKYLTSYRGTIDTNNPPPLTTNFDKGNIEYFDFNIAAAITPFKLDFKDLLGAITDIQNQFADIIEELINSIPIIGALLAAAFILEKLLTGDFISKRYNFSCYYNNRKYGQFIDMIQQRLYTTEISLGIKNIPNVEYVLEQKFINNVDGVELTDLNNPLIPRNKSKNLQLIDSGITPWDVDDFFNLKHVAYNDAMTEIFL
jgi:hypothetical protein